MKRKSLTEREHPTLSTASSILFSDRFSVWKCPEWHAINSFIWFLNFSLKSIDSVGPSNSVEFKMTLSRDKSRWIWSYCACLNEKKKKKRSEKFFSPNLSLHKKERKKKGKRRVFWHLDLWVGVMASIIVLTCSHKEIRSLNTLLLLKKKLLSLELLWLMVL